MVTMVAFFRVAAARKAGLSISLGPDWGPSGSKSSLGELKVADLVNKHALHGLFSDRDLVEMVTRKPVAAMGWSKRLEQLTEGYLADLLVLDRDYMTVPVDQIKDIKPLLTMVGGKIVYEKK